MITRFVEVVAGDHWGRYAVGTWDLAERARLSSLSHSRLVDDVGWNEQTVWVFDVTAGTAVVVWLGGDVVDLEPGLFAGFVRWLYRFHSPDLTVAATLPMLPPVVNLGADYLAAIDKFTTEAEVDDYVTEAGGPDDEED